ncbi:TrfA protein [Methylomagnum ishizawai]|uniref:TrfA protein n=2 Tax=Methylomagnum ishizawai TaxID=1760988 RepID=A0A1Y6D5P5_9GAMM|nr:TrfA protein [Methylomagnum ishizawai]
MARAGKLPVPAPTAVAEGKNPREVSAMTQRDPSALTPEEIQKEALPGESWEAAARRIARKRAEAGKSGTPPKPQNPTSAKAAPIIRLPFWPESQRGAPNEIVRSALFNARNRKQKRGYLANVDVYVIGDGSITYTGEELRQDDETVWLHLIHLARNTPPGELVEFGPHAFCKAVGWDASGKSYQRLRDCITRLQATALGVYSKRLKEGLSLSMIPFFRWKNAEGHALKTYQVRIAPEMVEFFGEVHYTQFEWEQRLALPSGLASWLHGYFASHREPFPVKLETIREGAGLTMERLDHLREKVAAALEALRTVGFLVSWRVEKDLVYVVRA